MSNPRAKQIENPRRHVIRVEKLGFMGEGIAHLPSDGVIFVPFVNVGEICEVQEVAKRKHYYEAVKIKTIEQGQDLAVPACEHFGMCGGCQLQHIAYPAQVEQKQEILQHVVNKRLDDDIAVKAIPCPNAYGYRRRVRMRQNEGQVGFFNMGSHLFLPIKHCPIMVSQLNDWLADPKNFPRPDTVHDISLDVEDDGTIKSYVGPEQQQMGFRQANAWGEKILQRLIAEAMGEGTKGILELFSGSGALVLPWFKPHADQSYLGIDGDPVNTERGRKKYGAVNIRFETGHLPGWLNVSERKDPKFFEPFNVILMDPARNGVGPKLRKAKVFQKMDKVIYISCNVQSWAKDVSILKMEHGFQLTDLRMVDMFPHTRHFEVFSVLTRNEKVRD